MDADGLLDLLLERVDAAPNLSVDAGLLVLAAYQGDGPLAQALTGLTIGQPPTRMSPEPVDVPVMYLKTVQVTGFRGIGATAALRLESAPGLTLIVGRNGSGKSSFAEGAEIALTGTNARWKDQSTVWKEGWRNLHTDDRTSVAIELVVDGQPGILKIWREWKGTDVAESDAWVQGQGERRRPLATIAWDSALRTYRPFLSYAELGAMLAGRPSELHDALFSILGLQRVANAQRRLRDAHKPLEERTKNLAATKKALQRSLSEVSEPRAQSAAKLLAARAPDLDALEVLVHASPEDRADLSALRARAALRGPDVDAAAAAAGRLSAATDVVRRVRGTSSEHAMSLVRLLEAGLEHVEHETLMCPLCGTAVGLTGDWREGVLDQVTRLRGEAKASSDALRSLEEARREVSSVAVAPPAGMDDGAQESWRRWAEAAQSQDVQTAVTALTTTTAALAEEIARMAASAAEQLAALEDVWRPLADQLTVWLLEAQACADQAAVRGHLKDAAEWLRSESARLRDDRLAPLTESSAWIWKMLRQESNVDLGAVRLEGSATQRRVELDITVDGVAGAALGVMSQGELHALALSLFLPRATLPESPFRFLLIDDPVQAMDPAKVEGLAQVLARVAKTHQVVVFTHDDRLPEAVRRLQLDATVWEVVRREQSVIELKKNEDPVARYLDDARALSRTDDLPESALLRVVPGLCRSALEAACHQVIRRKRFANGAKHSEVEELLRSLTTTTQVMALALFDDSRRGGDVMSKLNALGGWAGDAYKACQRGTHGKYAGDIRALVDDTQHLAQKIRA